MRRDELLRAVERYADRVHAHRVYTTGVNAEDRRLPAAVLKRWNDANEKAKIVRFM